MYNNVYQEYIDNIIGTPKSQFNFRETAYTNSAINPYFQNRNTGNNLDLERFYPEVYRLLYPMIQTACMKNTKPLTKETIDEMVKDIYSNFITDDAIILNINLTNDVRSNSKAASDRNTPKVTPNAKTQSNVQNEDKSFRPSNYVLSDLIRILIIRELVVKTENNMMLISPFRTNDINWAMQDYNLYENPINMYSNFDEGFNIF